MNPVNHGVFDPHLGAFPAQLRHYGAPEKEAQEIKEEDKLPRYVYEFFKEWSEELKAQEEKEKARQ